MPLALAIPLASSGARLYQDRHWTSDIVGGWLAGIALAAWSAAAYEMVPERSLARLERGIAHQARRVAAGVGDAVGDTVEDGLWGAERGVRRGRRQVKRGARHVERVVSRTAERADVASAAVGEGARQGLLLGLAQAVLDRFGGALTGRDAESDEDEPMDLR
jgi:hypothetical protein